MFPASTKASGQCLGTPDVCKVPTPGGPVPTPFPNIAMCAQANPGTCAMKVKIQNMPPLIMNSQIMMSSGDEAGTLGGVISNMIKGPGTYRRGSMKVFFDGKPAMFLTSMVGQNGANANVPAGTQVAPSQAVVLIN